MTQDCMRGHLPLYVILPDGGLHFISHCNKSEGHQREGFLFEAKVCAFVGEGTNAPPQAGNLERHLSRFHES